MDRGSVAARAIVGQFCPQQRWKLTNATTDQLTDASILVTVFAGTTGTVGREGPPVCEIGTQSYADLADALAAVTDGQTIKLLDDIIYNNQRQKRHDVAEDCIDVAWVPGAFEIPLIALKMASSGNYDAVICLGAVIRGSTTHYDYVCSEVSKGIAQASMQSGIPVMFGVLTTENIEQAIARAGSKEGNKGFDCAAGAIEMVNLIREIQAQ